MSNLHAAPEKSPERRDTVRAFPSCGYWGNPLCSIGIVQSCLRLLSRSRCPQGAVIFLSPVVDEVGFKSELLTSAVPTALSRLLSFGSASSAAPAALGFSLI